MANYSFRDPVDEIKDDEVINAGNFTQHTPSTEILKGKKLTINGGNWTNVKKQPEWTINGGTWTQISFCTNLRPELIDKGLIACEENCQHVVDIDDIEIDDVLIDTIYHYENKVVK